MLAPFSSWLGLDGIACCPADKYSREDELETKQTTKSVFAEDVEPPVSVQCEKPLPDATPTTAGGAASSAELPSPVSALEESPPVSPTAPEDPCALRKASDITEPGLSQVGVSRTGSVGTTDEVAQHAREEELQLWDPPKQAPLPEDQDVFNGLHARIAKANSVIAALREKVQADIIRGRTPTTPAEQREIDFCSTSTMIRYLCQQEGNVEKAFKAMKDTLAWRKKAFKDEVFLEDSPVPCCRACAKDPTSHCFLCVGKDAVGRHVVYSCAGRAANKSPEDGIEHMSAEMERLFANSKMPGSITWILDFAGFGFADCNPRTGVLAFPMFASHYPERFGQIVCLGLPYAFYPLYAAAGKIFDQATMQKVVTLKGDKAWKRYGDAYWSHDPGMRNWLDEVITCKGVPGSFPDAKFTQALRNTPETAPAIRILERCAARKK